MTKLKGKDIVFSAAKAALGSIPIAGAAASEILQLIVTSPLDKRREMWMNDIGERLKKLENENKIDLSQLQVNDLFIDLVIQTTQNALKTSNQEKIEYYKNLLINSVLESNPDEAEIQIFANLIDSFTVLHVKILDLFDDPPEWFKRNGREFPNQTMGSLSLVLEGAFPELKGRQDFYNLLWSDLERAGFHRTGSLLALISSSGLLASRTTDFGKRFLNFIKNQ